MATRGPGGRAATNTSRTRPASTPMRTYDRPGGSRNRFSTREPATSQTTPRVPNFGADYKNEELQQLVNVQRHRREGADIRGGGGMASMTEGILPKPAATPAGRSNTKTEVNANGVEQTFTNTGAINMPGLADVDMTGIANFNGPSFPTQAETNKITDGYSFTASEFLTSPKNEDGSAFEIPGGAPTTTNIAINGNTFRPNTFEKGGAGDIGGLDGFKPGGKFAGAPTATDGQTDKANDTEFNGPDPMAYATSGEEMRRRSAFLDAPDSMEGMQRVAAGMGMGNQGLRNFANVDGVAKEMSSKKRREILNAAPGEAQALKDKWVQSLKTSNEDEPQTASSAQNPTQPSGTSTFNTDQKLNLPTEAGAVDYMNNNKADDLSIGNKTKLNPDNFTNTGLNYGSFQTQKLGL